MIIIMETFIETPNMSEILYEEFMEPLGISAYKLAQAIHVFKYLLFGLDHWKKF